LSTAAFAAKDDVVIEGSVGAITSSTQFRVGDNTIVCGSEATAILKYGAQEVTIPFEREAIRSGMKVTVKGKRDPVSGQIQAASVTAVLREETAAMTNAGDSFVRGTALMEKTPAVTKTGAGWFGIIFADGRKIRFTKFTKVEFVPNKSERAQASKDPASSIKSVSELGPNVFVSYQGLPYSNGTIIAERLVFMRNENDRAKQALREKYEPQVTEPDYAAGKPGKLVIESQGELPINPSQALQNKVNEVGLRLVPAFQKFLADTDPLKIRFRFYVVDTKKVGLCSFPSGVFLVSANLISRLDNEAQLAAVLAADIALVVQEQLNDVWAHSKLINAARLGGLGGSFAALAVPPLAIPAGALSMYSDAAHERIILATDQAGRLAPGYMLDAGYDPREAEKAFESLGKKPKTDNKLQLMERQYYGAMRPVARDVLKETYSDIKLTDLVTDTKDYKELLVQLRSVRQ
jgi:hypothetical protein